MAKRLRVPGNYRPPTASPPQQASRPKGAYAKGEPNPLQFLQVKMARFCWQVPLKTKRCRVPATGFHSLTRLPTVGTRRGTKHMWLLSSWLWGLPKVTDVKHSHKCNG